MNTSPENQLKILLAQPRFQQAIAAHAKSNPEKDPVKKVHQAVGSLAPHLADVAAQHAQVARDEAQKVPKSSVNYRPGSVAEHCGNCSMYRNPHTCTHVRGVIDPSATCKDWEVQKNSGVEKQPSRLAHTQETAGATPASATIQAHPSILSQARQAPDGHHYVPDPNRPGKFARVITGRGNPVAQQKPADDLGRGGPPNNGNKSYGADDESGVNDSMATPQDRQDDQVRTIDFIRHGETDMNESADKGRSIDLIRGHHDVPLNENGKKQAAATGDELRADPPHFLVSSDLCRSRLTAKIISERTGVPVAGASDHFRPWDAGQLTGKPSKTAVPIMAKFAEQAPDQPLPKGESFHTFLGRFFIGLHHVLTANPGKRVGVVAHHRNERALHSWAAKGYPPDGSIDHRAFAEKGEDPGHVQRIQIPMDRLAQVAQRYRNAAMAQPPAQKQIRDDQPGDE